MTNRIIKIINNMINDVKADHKQCNGRVSEIQEAIFQSCSPEVFYKVNHLIIEKLYPQIEAKHLEAQEQLETLSYLVTQEAADDYSDLSLSGCISVVVNLFG